MWGGGFYYSGKRRASVEIKEVNSPAFWAAKGGELEDLVHELDTEGADVNEKGYKNRTLLHEVVEHGHSDLICLLVGRNAEVNSTTTSGSTPLHFAARCGQVDAVQALIAAGASVNAQKEDGWTASHLAARNNHKEVLEILLQHDVSLSLKNNADQTPLDVAIGEAKEYLSSLTPEEEAR
mmetsp:Transcript_4809/g.6165  ORF Transcript_4809/g.6165 Transcript_4809/m.6165 type:complete len:180 (-) Transcript_4809:557-1096(-)|eukprot:CAMPEP_0201482514 /NCGR_PEP_ID=MMETSP0151_2-20130828/6802_1 /ASSEMBLY_ACC=CAM_ASM_000257 /TAXON_ID=200890 /ORGANISM="Paramoeba atlantica, Strain 621/1 / CCAP 1560/9" /LENGTH=179 /DNA_ID=CAMNT_0047865259 /DNA_START=102 /DNA_END=641 /DNA_ORIENTATION=-